MTSKTIQIYPVIEINPWEIDHDEELDLKPGQDFSDFAIEVFRQNGINHIKKLDPYGYSSVKIMDVNDSDLTILIERELNDAEIPDNGLDAVATFSGGLVVSSMDGTVIHHQCCGSIADYKNWQKAIKNAPGQWEQVWIGHPWIYARVKENRVELSEYIEHTGTLDCDLEVKLQINPEEFSSALNTAVEEILSFKKRIFDILSDTMPDIARELTEILVENEYPAND